MQILRYELRSPRAGSPYFVIESDGRPKLYAAEGWPDDAYPMLYLKPKFCEPHVKVRCSTYTKLDPPYYFIGVPSETRFGEIQYIGDPRRSSLDINHRVLDYASEQTFFWKEKNPSKILWYRLGRRAILELTLAGGLLAGHVEYWEKLEDRLNQRFGLIEFFYDSEPTEANALLHLSALAFLLTKYRQTGDHPRSGG